MKKLLKAITIAFPVGRLGRQNFACIFKGDCYHYLGDMENELSSLFESFKYAPGGESCSRIGYSFQKTKAI